MAGLLKSKRAWIAALAALFIAVIVVGFLVFHGIGSRAQLTPTTPPISTNTEFSNPEPVTIQGYDGPAEDAYITPDNRYLIFDSHTDNPTQIPSDLYWAKRVDYKTFTFLGKIQGVNEDLPGAYVKAIQASGNMDLAGNFYFMTSKYYDQSLMTIYHGIFKDGTVTDVKPVLGISRNQRGWVTMEAEITADGATLYFGDFQFGDNGQPKASRIVVAAKNPDGSFTRLSKSDELLKNVNALGSVLFNAMVSKDGLELFFTKFVLPPIGPKIYVAKRNSTSEPFGVPQLIAAGDGFVESGSISPDGKYLYYHKVLNSSNAKLYVMSRQ